MKEHLGEGQSFEKAKFKVEKGGEINVQFNPSEYSLSRRVKYSENDEMESIDNMQYLGTELGQLDLVLYFDTTPLKTVNPNTKKPQSVAEKVKHIEQLAGRMGEGGHRPPKVTFIWGKFSYDGIVSHVKTTYTLFDSDGTPLRANMNVTIAKFLEESKNNPKSSPDRTKARVLSEDSSIWAMAQKEYDDAREWRRIAKANQILNPFEIETGRVLEVPAIVEEDY